MKARGLVVVLALVLATLATAGVFLYTRGVKQEATTGGTQTTVIVSKTNIPANTDLSQMIRQGEFVEKKVPKADLIEGAVTRVSQLDGRRNNVPIIAGEQIPISRVTAANVPGGVLGIPDGYQAMTIALDAPRAVAGALSAGDNVSVYATFENAQGAAKAAAGGQGQGLTTTVVLVPQVEVLRVIRPTVSSGIEGQSQPTVSGTVTLTLALLPQDAQKFVFALEEGKVYLSLLAPGEKGTPEKRITWAQVLK
jgi:pilus assembly protein CpaB